jgi:hypothetical protein
MALIPIKTVVSNAPFTGVRDDTELGLVVVQTVNSGPERLIGRKVSLCMDDPHIAASLALNLLEMVPRACVRLIKEDILRLLDMAEKDAMPVKPKVEAKTICSLCGSDGYVSHETAEMSGQMHGDTTCPECNGRGWLME